jgi:ABC-type uncharacterized transport system permease subunit
MNWRLVLVLGIIFGVLMGLGTVMGWPAWLGYGTGIAAVVISAVMLARAGDKAFNNGFCTGVLIGVLQLVLGLVFWDQFTANHHHLLEGWSPLHEYMDMSELKTYMWTCIPPIAVFYGLVIGSISWLLKRFFGLGKKSKAAVVGQFESPSLATSSMLQIFCVTPALTAGVSPPNVLCGRTKL